MGFVRPLRVICAAAGLAAVPWLHAQGFTADYDIARLSTAESTPLVRVASALPLGADLSGPGLSLRAGRHWFGQMDVVQTPVSSLAAGSAVELVNVAGGYRWSNGQTLSLQVSRGRGPAQRLGLALNYDWPRYFVRFSYDQGRLNLLTPQDSLRLSAGVRF